MNALPKIVIVGAGRIAWHLSKRLKSKGLPVAQVISRTAENVEALAESLHTAWSDLPADLLPDADWVILAVRDDAIEEVAEAFAPYVKNALVTHTSGGTAGAVLAVHFERYGVFYPLQSFSLEHMPVWSKIPFCVDAQSDEDVLFLKKIAKTIGNLVYRVNDEQRALLHVAAVFANNFANRCFAIAEKILDENDLPFELLHPLMEETLAKALQDSPARMQTGPAMRGDVDTVRRHLNLLAENLEWREIYRELSENINPDLKV
ncbi:MAG: DUF2520 domain-containing protein [Phycisphaerae bacterium]|nr:DUF2520 domain-containing protein [Saprospiraceae bacterium]